MTKASSFNIAHLVPSLESFMLSKDLQQASAGLSQFTQTISGTGHRLDGKSLIAFIEKIVSLPADQAPQLIGQIALDLDMIAGGHLEHFTVLGLSEEALIKGNTAWLAMLIQFAPSQVCESMFSVSRTRALMEWVNTPSPTPDMSLPTPPELLTGLIVSELSQTSPLHTFGVSGKMIKMLAHLHSTHPTTFYSLMTPTAFDRIDQLVGTQNNLSDLTEEVVLLKRAWLQQQAGPQSDRRARPPQL